MSSEQPASPQASSLDISGEVNLDLLHEPTTDATEEPTSEPYDPEPLREQLRGWIAVGLLVLLAVVVVAALTALFVGIDSDSAKDMISLILTPIVGLVSAVTGFYYASTKGGK